MKLYKKIPLEGDRLSAEHLSHLGEGEELTVVCENVAEKDNARQNAYYVRRNVPRPDGLSYSISTSNLQNTVTVSLTRVCDNVKS